MNTLSCCPDFGDFYPNENRAFNHTGTSIAAQMVKNLPAVLETPVQSLGWEDSLEKAMATHSSILAWRIPWTEGPGGVQSMGLPRVGLSGVTFTSLPTTALFDFFPPRMTFLSTPRGPEFSPVDTRVVSVGPASP